jgi:hypothetical protein
MECAASSSSMLSHRNVLKLREKKSSTGTVAIVIRYTDTDVEAIAA